MFSRAICCNMSYKIDIGHAQNSESEQKNCQPSFCAVTPINNNKKTK